MSGLFILQGIRVYFSLQEKGIPLPYQRGKMGEIYFCPIEMGQLGRNSQRISREYT